MGGYNGTEYGARRSPESGVQERGHHHGYAAETHDPERVGLGLRTIIYAFWLGENICRLFTEG